MRSIPLTNRKQEVVGYTIVDDVDYSIAAPLSWNLHSAGYACRRGETYKGYLHRLIVERKIGRKLKPKEKVDHKDGDGLNNRRGNLRVTAHHENLCNRNKPINPKATSQYKGVASVQDSSTWRARITVNKKQIRLGNFPTEREAALAYNEAASRLHGRFARLNDV